MSGVAVAEDFSAIQTSHPNNNHLIQNTLRKQQNSDKSLTFGGTVSKVNKAGTTAFEID